MQNVFNLLCVEEGFTSIHCHHELQSRRLGRSHESLCPLHDEKSTVCNHSTHLIFTVTGLTADCNCRNRVFFHTPLHLTFSYETKQGLAIVESTWEPKSSTSHLKECVPSSLSKILPLYTQKKAITFTHKDDICWVFIEEAPQKTINCISLNDRPRSRTWLDSLFRHAFLKI